MCIFPTQIPYLKVYRSVAIKNQWVAIIHSIHVWLQRQPNDIPLKLWLSKLGNTYCKVNHQLSKYPLGSFILLRKADWFHHGKNQDHAEDGLHSINEECQIQSQSAPGPRHAHVACIPGMLASLLYKTRRVSWRKKTNACGASRLISMIKMMLG